MLNCSDKAFEPISLRHWTNYREQCENSFESPVRYNCRSDHVQQKTAANSQLTNRITPAAIVNLAIVWLIFPGSYVCQFGTGWNGTDLP